MMGRSPYDGLRSLYLSSVLAVEDAGAAPLLGGAIGPKIPIDGAVSR